MTEEEYHRLCEEHDVLVQAQVSLTKQRRALLLRIQSLRGEVIFLQTRMDELLEMVRGYEKNTHDELDLRYKDVTYRKRQRAEQVLKQTKLLNIAPESRAVFLPY